MVGYPKIDQVATGEQIRKLRQENGYSVHDLSTLLGFSNDQAVYKWQRGDNLPSTNNLLALSKLFGVQMEDIIREEIDNE